MKCLLLQKGLLPQGDTYCCETNALYVITLIKVVRKIASKMRMVGFQQALLLAEAFFMVDVDSVE